MKYTEHKLSDFQCRVLSQIVNNRQRNYFGPTLDSLELRGLIECRGLDPHHQDGDGLYRRPLWEATEAGKTALERARREGW